MTWRSSTTPADRIFGSLLYLLPLMDALITYGFTGFFSQFPELRFLLTPFLPLIQVYVSILSIGGGFSLGGLLIFLGLFFLVVRNERISHFIRFNAMQSIIIGIVMSIFGIIWQFALSPIFGGSLIESTLYNVVFLGVLAATGYSIVQSVLGRYPEIPTLSDAAYTYVR